MRGQVKAGGTVDFTTTLSSEVAIPPVAVASDGTGGGEFSLNVSGTELTYNIEVLESSLTGSITAAHFHNAPAGSQGDIVRDLQFGSTATGTWSSTEANQPLTPALVGQLLASRIYVNIHTAANGAGEVRGQVRVGAPIIQKLLLSEIVARPTAGEFVEIYNPGSVTVDLSNYYLANSTFQFGNTFYYQLVEGGGGGGSFADFNARFPDGAMIQPGEYQTIAISGDSLFFAVYSVLPTYELYEDGTNFGNDVPDMREAVPGSIAGQGGFSNGDEDAILFYWDGLSDLVVDIDYVIYDEGDGGINEQVDKTGVSIDGPDPGTDSTMYLPDTPIANQVPAPINNTADGFSTHRIDFTEGNQTPTGGNGVTGADETSEDLNNTFTDNSVPSPNAQWKKPPPPPKKLLISEIVARPTAGEFVEIYNPGSEAVDLSYYYLANSTFQFGNTYYYQLVEGGGGGGTFADFNARFPDGAMIQPGEYQTIAISGDSLFFAVYSVLPTYELYEDGTNFGNDVPDMREAVPGSIAGQGGFSNGDEDAILFYWDGLSDLVVDIDYVIYDEGDGGINEQVDKTGVSIDGPDPGTDSTMYLPDTPIANQVPAPINNTADGFSTHRIDYTEGNQTPTGGNGVTGADETSEDLNNTFTDNSTPSPNAPGQIVGVEDLSIVIPDRFVLHGNYPNPFNPSTTIRYDLPTNADVRIVIFDILGRQVLTIENNNVSAGSALTIEINASELSSGLYFYQLIAKLKEKTEIKTGKMTLLK